jgi:hypothetical protein
MRFDYRTLRLTLVSCLILVSAPLLANEQIATRAIGEIKQQDGLWQTTTKPATLVIGEPNLGQVQVRFQLWLAKGATTLALLPETPGDLRGNAAMRVSITGDAAGRALTFRTVQLDPKTGKPLAKAETEKPVVMQFLPKEKEVRTVPDAAPGILQPKSWQGRWLNVRVDFELDMLSLWIEGRMVHRRPRPVEAKGALTISLGAGDQVRNISSEPLSSHDRFVRIDLDTYSNTQLEKPVAKGVLELDGVPFTLADNGRGVLDMRNAGWMDWKRDQRNYREDYDGGAPYLDDMRQPMLRVPSADYVAAHVLAVADEDSNHTAVLTLRAGRYGWNDQTIQHNFSTEVPRTGGDASIDGFHHVSVPMTEAFAQDIETYFDIELTKELRVAVRQDSPVRHRIRPLGLPLTHSPISVGLPGTGIPVRCESTEYIGIVALPPAIGLGVTLSTPAWPSKLATGS